MTTSTARRRTAAKKPVKKPVKKKTVSKNPVSWVAWGVAFTINVVRRTKMLKGMYDGALDNWKAKSESNAVVHTVDNPDGVSPKPKRGWIECINCNGDGTSSWHPPHTAGEHMDKMHPGKQSPDTSGSAGTQASKASSQRTTNQTKTAAKGTGTRRRRASTAQPDLQQLTDEQIAQGQGRPRGGSRGRSNRGGTTKKTSNVISLTSRKWGAGMANLDGLVSSMDSWAASPPEDWRQLKAEADAITEAFRGIASAFRRRGEVLVEEYDIQPDCVEPYDDAANILSQVGDQAAEVANRIESRYKQLEEEINKNGVTEKTVGFFRET